MDGIKISDLDTINSVDHDDIVVSVIDTSSNGTKNITVGDFAKSTISQDADNLLEDDSNGLIKADADNFISGDADNLLEKGTDQKLLVDPDNLISADGGNVLVKSGTDQKLYVPTGTVPDATESVKGKAELATQAETDAGTDDTRIVTPKKLNDSVHIQNYFLKETITISSPVTNFEIKDLDPTKTYEIEISELSVDADSDLLYTASDDNGVSYKNTAYYSNGYSNRSDTNTLDGSDGGNTSSIRLNSFINNVRTNLGLSNASYSSNIILFRSSNRLNHFICNYLHEDSGNHLSGGNTNGGVRNTDIDAIKITASGGNNITNAIIKVWEKS